MPYLGKSPSQGVRTRFQFTPNAGTTSISGADANGLTLSFTDGNYVDVYLNGVMLKAGVDYNTNTANTIAGLSATVASDVVDIVVYDTFSLFGGTLEGNVKVNNGTFNVTGAGDFDSTLNVDGVVTANAGVVVDNITIDGTEIDLSSGNLTIDVANDIILDSGDGDIQLKDTGSTFLNIYESSDHAYLYNPRSNGDIIFQGNGVSEALRLDMSASGAATFGGTTTLSDDVTFTGANYNAVWDKSDNSLEFGDEARVKFGADTDFQIYSSGGHVYAQSGSSSNFIITTDTFRLKNQANNADVIAGNGGGAVELYHNGSKKIETTSSGVTVTGTSIIQSGTNPIINLETPWSSGNYGQIRLGYIAGDERSITGHYDDGIKVKVNAHTHTFDINGRLGIGTTSPSRNLSIVDGSVPLLQLALSTDQAAGNGFELAFDGVAAYLAQRENLPIVFKTNDTERMRIDNSGNVGIGTTNPTAGLTLEGTDGATSTTFMLTSTGVASAGLACDGSGLNFGADTGGFVFKTGASANDPTDSGTQRMKISSAGGTRFGLTGTAHGVIDINVGVSSASYIFDFIDEGGIRRMVIYPDGDIQNADNSYGAFSDEKLKENISDASSQWDDIKALKIRKYSLKSDKLSSANKLGVIAQELEASGMSGLVTESPDATNDNPDIDTTTKSVKYSILYMKAVKALQEAMTRIETLEAKVAKLEGG